MQLIGFLYCTWPWVSGERNPFDRCPPENLIPCERSSSMRLKISDSACSGIVCESPREEFHKSQNGAELKSYFKGTIVYLKILYLEQCCWHFENVGLRSQYFDLTASYRPHCAKDHTPGLWLGPGSQNISRSCFQMLLFLLEITPLLKIFVIIMESMWTSENRRVFWRGNQFEFTPVMSKCLQMTRATSSGHICTNEYQSFSEGKYFAATVHICFSLQWTPALQLGGRQSGPYVLLASAVVRFCAADCRIAPK